MKGKISIILETEVIKQLRKIAKNRERDLSKQIRFMLIESIKENY